MEFSNLIPSLFRFLNCLTLISMSLSPPLFISLFFSARSIHLLTVSYRMKEAYKLAGTLEVGTTKFLDYTQKEIEIAENDLICCIVSFAPLFYSLSTHFSFSIAPTFSRILSRNPSLFLSYHIDYNEVSHQFNAPGLGTMMWVCITAASLFLLVLFFRVAKQQLANK